MKSTRFVPQPQSCSGGTHFYYYLSPYKKKDNPNLVTTNHRVLPNLTRSYGMVLCPNYLVQLVPVINNMTGAHCNVEKWDSPLSFVGEPSLFSLSLSPTTPQRNIWYQCRVSLFPTFSLTSYPFVCMCTSITHSNIRTGILSL